MKVTPYQPLPTTDIASSNKPARVSAADALPQQLPNRTAEQVVKEQLLAQVVANRKDGLTQLRTLSGGNLVNLTTGQALKTGQLVLLKNTQTSGRTELSVQTGAPLISQILKRLVPAGGNLKNLLQNVMSLQTAARPIANPGNTSNAPTPIQNNLVRSPATGWFKFLSQSTPPGQTSIDARSGTPTPSKPAQPSVVPSGALSKLTALLGTTASKQDSSNAGANIPPILQALTPTASLRDPSNIPPLLQPGQTPPLLKLVMPMLQRTIMQAPVNAEQQQARDSQLTAFTQLAARVLLGAIRAPAAGNELELGRSEWIGRFDQSLDTLQVGLSVIRDPVKEKGRDTGEEDQPLTTPVRQWRVRLAFEFDELGFITAFILLSDHQKMEVQFWTERESTRIKLQQFRQQFDQRLEQAVSRFGVENLSVDVFEGTPPKPKRNITQHLIDETA
jgi:hypothetical protein